MHPYEELFAAQFGSGWKALSFWKGRSGLYAILKALGIRTGDEVIIPGYTCVAVPAAVRHAGATPVYADVRAANYNIDPASVERLITPRTRALIAQHTYGIPADVENLASLAKTYGLALIEDCAHVLVGSRHGNRFLGTFGNAAFFSSQWSKPYTTGLGGMAITADRELAVKLRSVQGEFRQPPLLHALRLRSQYTIYRRFFKPELFWDGLRYFHFLSRLGLFVGSSSSSELNGGEPCDLAWRMSDFQESVGLAGLHGVIGNASHRRKLATYYNRALSDARWHVAPLPCNGETALVRFPLLVSDRDELLRKSCANRVELGSWFETPLHPIPLREHYRYGYEIGSCPTAESVAARAINLPLHERVTDAGAARIIEFVLSKAKKQDETGFFARGS
jgi:dTDP-4-amino-4,6-dideoxygalactose transaminase